MRKKNPFIYIFLILSGILFISACSQSVPEVRSANCSLILDFNSNAEKPLVKMSAYAQSESEVRRYDSITIRSNTNDYCWNVYDIIKVKENKRTYVGYNNLVMPEDIRFPTGSYSVTFKTLDEEETEVSVNLNYDTSIYNLKKSDVSSFIQKKNYRHKFAIYSKDDILLFYGQLSSEDSTPEKISSNYPNGAYFNEIWIAPNGSVTFIMAKTILEQETES